MKRIPLLSFLLLSCIARTARADSTAFAPDHLQLATGVGDFVATEGAGPIAPWTAQLMASFRWNDASLTVERGVATQTVVGARAFVDVVGGIELGRWAGIGVDLPVLLDDGGALGDLRIVPRVELVHRGAFGLAATLGLRVPTGNTSKFVGEGMVVFEPRVAAQMDAGWFHVGLNVGVRVRQERQYIDLKVGDEVFGSLAVAIKPRPYIDGLVELHADTAMSSQFGAQQVSPVELLLGLGGGARGVRVGGVFGLGLVDGFGAARFRALLTVEIRRAPKPRETLVRVSPPPPRQVIVAAQEAPPPSVTPAPSPEPPPMPPTPPTMVAHVDEPDVAVSPGRIELSHPVFFDTNRRRIHHRYNAELVQLAHVLMRQTQLGTIWIEGHTDATGPARWNLELSRRRAAALVTFLVAHGVPRERLHPVGYGEAGPLVSARAGVPVDKNRRVHFFTAGDSAPDGVASSLAKESP